MGKGKLLKYRDQERPHGKITLKKKKKTEGRERTNHEDIWEKGIPAE